VRGKTTRTTVSGLVKRPYATHTPEPAMGDDLTSASAPDVFSHRIVGWTTSMSKETNLVLDAIGRGLHQRPYGTIGSLRKQTTGRVRDPVRARRSDQSSRLTPTTSLYQA
jgi:transposase InsO family protein